MDSSTSTPPLGIDSIIVGGGEIGARMRALDWSSTLGPVERWPQSLRSAISILLPSRAQIILFWGPDFITLYNDAYRPVFGGKHPWALGRPARECWSEIRGVLGPLLEGVVRTGEPFWAQDHPFFIERHGYLEETYFDVSYDPVRVEDGSVGGVFCIVSETTRRVLGERRLRTLRELGVGTSGATTVVDVCREAAAALATDPADIAFSLFYLTDGHGHHARLTPGWLRSEMMLDNFGVAEGTWRDAPNAPADFALSESPRYIGRAFVALATDPDRARWNQQSVSSGQLARIYGFTDVDGSRPDIWRYIEEVRERGLRAHLDDYR